MPLAMYEIDFPDNDPFVHARWRAEVVEPGEYLDPANEYWGIAFTRGADGATRVELAGPAPAPRTLVGVPGERHWGLEFHAHVIVAGLVKSDLLGVLAPLPVSEGEFELAGHRHRVPQYRQLGDFVRELAAAGILSIDEEVRRAITGDRSGWSARSWQRRIKAATGVTPSQIAQFSRARAAAAALLEGRAPADVAAQLGFSDHAHLTRSLVALRSELPKNLRRRRS